MAGSYDHVTKRGGKFIGDDFTSMIENLGDAWEACEQMHWMIDHLANRVAQQYGWMEEDVLEVERCKVIKEAEDAWYKHINPTG